MQSSQRNVNGSKRRATFGKEGWCACAVRRKGSPARLLLAASAAVSLGGAAALGGSPRTYFIFDLGTLPTGTTSRALALNNLGEVVGEAQFSAQVGNHAIVWLWGPNYGLQERVMHDLNDLVGLSDLTATTAADINIFGNIAGTQTPFVGDEAVVWTLDDQPPHIHDFCGLGVAGFIPTKALGINDGDPAREIPPMVVGRGLTTGLPQVRGFRVPFIGCPFVADSQHRLDPIPTPTPHGDTGVAAVDVSNGSVAAAPLIAGATNDLNDPNPCGPLSLPETLDGQWWSSAAVTPISATPLNQLLDDMPITGHESNGVNDARQLVGSGMLPEPICRRIATFWQNIGADPFPLGTVDGIPSSNFTVANAINEPNGLAIQVVGKNLTQDHAYLWQRDVVGAWEPVIDLNDRLINTCGWRLLIEATDINDSGWIAGIGDRLDSPGTVERALVLVPIDPQSKCKSDLTCDCHVDGIDLGILLSDWSIPVGSPGCGGVTPCRSDINDDGVVDGIDLGFLLSDWSAGSDYCEPSVCGPPGEMLMGGAMMSSEAVSGPSTPALEELIQILLEQGHDDLAELLQEVYGGS